MPKDESSRAGTVRKLPFSVSKLVRHEEIRAGPFLALMADHSSSGSGAVDRTPFNEGAVALARLATQGARNVPANLYVDPFAERAAVVTLIAASWPLDLVREVKTRRVPPVISAAAARSSPS